MKYLKFTYVDSVTEISVAAEPARNGPKFPPIEGLVHQWSRESAWPTEVPEFFGTCPDDAMTSIDGVLEVLNEDDYEAQRTYELHLRRDSISAEARFQRNQMLWQSDWTQIADAPLSAEEKSAWAQYRQSLRDVTSQPEFPFSVQWPEQPA